jgi:geranylgeranyl diphosphate synthase type II
MADRMQSDATETAMQLLRQDGERLTEYFQQILRRYVDAPPRLMESIDYSLSAGGKRLRPVLTMECFRACSSNHTKQSEASALAAAAAMELIHTFSLVHDDLPAMDDDDLRRGRPTNHKVFGEAMAILAGDAMVTIAFEVIANDAEPAVGAALIRDLAHSSGPCGMIGGQVLDMDGENRSLSLHELQRIHRMKTGALLTCSCRLGALAAGANSAQLASVTEFGKHLGLAFQIVDDVLDVTSTPEQMGKATNKDAGKGKNTYPELLGLENSQKEAVKQLDAALAAIAPFGETGHRLALLARFVVEREA